MVNAEANAEENKRLKDPGRIATIRATPCASTRKAADPNRADKLEAGEKEVVEAAIKDLEESLNG